jgi:hypothetical protein
MWPPFAGIGSFFARKSPLKAEKINVNGQKSGGHGPGTKQKVPRPPIVLPL